MDTLMKDNHALIVGSIGLDTIETASDRKESILGGSATYATIAAGKSSSVHLVGVVGNDFPMEGMNIFKDITFDLSNLEQKKGKTFSWGAKYADNWDNRDTLFTELGVFNDFNPLLTDQNKEVPIIFLANIHPLLQLSVLNQCNKRKCVIIDTMNLWIDTEREKLKEVISSCDVLLINEFEAEQFTKRKEHDDQGTVLQSLGPQNIIIKCGSKGARLYSGHQLDTIGVFPVNNVVDPTGAGDSFAGGFIGYLAATTDFSDRGFRRAAVVGTVMGSFAVESFGTERIASLSNKEINQRFRALSSLTQFEPLPEQESLPSTHTT